jgi:hypothetical protein
VFSDVLTFLDFVDVFAEDFEEDMKYLAEPI